MSMSYFTVLLYFLLYARCSSQDQPVVETAAGTIRGHHKLSYNSRIFSAFEGIPYAKPPLGELRFKEPQDTEPWSGIWDATTLHECIQINTNNFEVVGNEDCLYLNVYVPRIKPISNENLDVIVFLHGGAFMFGNPTQGGPEYLMDRDVLYVNLNYRIGLIGFLSTEDHVIPGNNGLKDQVSALKWIKNNIKQFGGNPESVTLTGISAGGSAVHFHYLSPLSKGLFHRGISQSGTALVPWALQEAPLEKARKLAASVGCNQQLADDFVQCLRQRPAQQLVGKTEIFFGYREYPLAPFAPVVEKIADEAFLPEHPYALLESGRVINVPWIASVTKDEGIYPVITFIDKLNEIEEHWNDTMTHLLDYNYTVADDKKSYVADTIKKHYFHEKKLSNDTVQQLIKLFGDRYFILGFEEALKLHSKAVASPVYPYVYCYQGEQFLSKLFNIHHRYGVAHGEDGYLLHYVTVFGVKVNKGKLSVSDESIKELLLDIVTSFAKTGKPMSQKIKWEPISNASDFGYLFIRNANDVKMFHQELAPSEFWKTLPITENDQLLLRRDEL